MPGFVYQFSEESLSLWSAPLVIWRKGCVAYGFGCFNNCGCLKLKTWALFLWCHIAFVHRSIRKLICYHGKTAGGNSFISAFAIAMLFNMSFSLRSPFVCCLEFDFKNDLVAPNEMSWNNIYSSWCCVFWKVSPKHSHTVHKLMFTFELNLFKCDSHWFIFTTVHFPKML